MKFKTKKHIENGLLSASQKHLSYIATEHGHEFFELEYVLEGEGCPTSIMLRCRKTATGGHAA